LKLKLEFTKRQDQHLPVSQIMKTFLQFVFYFFRDSQEKKSTVTLADFEIVSWWDWNYLKRQKEE